MGRPSPASTASTAKLRAAAEPEDGLEDELDKEARSSALDTWAWMVWFFIRENT